MLYRYSEWDGTQEIRPLDPDEIIDLIAEDLLEEGDLRRALDRLMMNGGRRPDGDRLQGLRDLLQRLRQRRQEKMEQFNLESPLSDIAERLEAIVEREREAMDQRIIDAAESGAPQEMQDLLRQVVTRKRDHLDALPPDAGSMLQRLMDYEFMDDQARDDFNDLVNELRQKMMGSYFQNLKQGLENMTPEDLAPVREMVRELNKMLQKRLNGENTDQDFQDFMARFGDMFPDDLKDLDDLIDYMHKQAAQMQSLMKSLSEEQRDQLQEMMEALLRDDRLSWDLMQMSGMLEQITGQPLGMRFSLEGDQPLGFEEALRLMDQLGDYQELERQFLEAMREMDAGKIDQDLANELLGPDAGAMLEELRRIMQLLEESGLIKRGRNDIELTPKAIRRIGQRALQEIFSELRKDRAGQHNARNQGASAEQTPDTKPWEFGDAFLLDIGKSIANAVKRGGAGSPVQVDVKDLEIFKTEHLITASTVIVLDASMSMIRSGAFTEAKRVAVALDTLMRGRFPRDYLELVVFSYFAIALKAGRLLDSDWAINPRGTNIQEALRQARSMLRKRKATNRQIILITDGQPTMYTTPSGEVIRGWSTGDWPRYSPEAMEETLKEVRRCTRDGIRINLFMMANDPALVAFGKAMTQINKGRAFMSTPGRLGRYVFFDYLKGKSKII